MDYEPINVICPECGSEKCHFLISAQTPMRIMCAICSNTSERVEQRHFCACPRCQGSSFKHVCQLCNGRRWVRV